jgi:hypothetical protein
VTRGGGRGRRGRERCLRPRRFYLLPKCSTECGEDRQVMEVASFNFRKFQSRLRQRAQKLENGSQFFQGPSCIKLYRRASLYFYESFFWFSRIAPPFSVRRLLGSACPPAAAASTRGSTLHLPARCMKQNGFMLTYVGDFENCGPILRSCVNHFRSCDSPTPPTYLYLDRNSLMGGNQSTPDAPHQSSVADPSVPSPTPVNQHQPPSDVQTPPADPGITVVNAGKSSSRPLHVGNGNVDTSR